MTHDEQKLLIQQLLDRIETLELENMVLKADLNTVDISSETYNPLIEEAIRRKSIQSLTEKILVDIDKCCTKDLTGSGLVILPTGIIGCSGENVGWFDDEEDKLWYI